MLPNLSTTWVRSHPKQKCYKKDNTELQISAYQWPHLPQLMQLWVLFIRAQEYSIELKQLHYWSIWNSSDGCKLHTASLHGDTSVPCTQHWKSTHRMLRRSLLHSLSEDFLVRFQKSLWLKILVLLFSVFLTRISKKSLKYYHEPSLQAFKNQLQKALLKC